MSAHNDDKTGASAERTRQAKLEKAIPGEFKVPTLRNLLLTAPYGRDGRAETLAEVVRHYASLDTASLRAKDGKPVKPLNLTKEEQTDLVVFLETLSTFSNPWRPEDPNGRCY
jgi:cytochrome c peroxidase